MRLGEHRKVRIIQDEPKRLELAQRLLRPGRAVERDALAVNSWPQSAILMRGRVTLIGQHLFKRADRHEKTRKKAG